MTLATRARSSRQNRAPAGYGKRISGVDGGEKPGVLSDRTPSIAIECPSS
jgi:hypothetical protein